MNDLIEKHLAFAHAVAAEVLKKYPARIDREEVERASELGLLQAARAYDANRGIAFTTFAYYRIKGAIYDDLRRSFRAARFEEAANEYMTDYSESSFKPGTPHDTYHEVKNIAATVTTSYLLSLESLSREPEQKDLKSPLDLMLLGEKREKIESALRQLPSKNREVLRKYYFDDLSYEEIGQQMNLSRSWVCRVHAKGLELMKNFLLRQQINVSPTRSDVRIVKPVMNKRRRDRVQSRRDERRIPICKVAHQKHYSVD
jgi:RNA polymerase sigma factor FliA